MFKRIFVLSFFALFTNFLYSQSLHSSDKEVITLHWLANEKVYVGEQFQGEELNFKNAVHDHSLSSLPFYSQSYLNLIITEVKLSDIVYTTIDEQQLIPSNFNQQEPEILISKGFMNKKPISGFKFIPIRKNPTNGNYEKILSFTLEVVKQTHISPKTYLQRYSKNNSVLSDGNWYKIGVGKSGIYKLNYSYLKSIGIEPSQLDINRFGVYGIQGGILPQENSKFRYDDLEELPIQFMDGGDGKFNESDVILFYADSPESKVLDTVNTIFRHVRNYYSDSVFYFLTPDKGNLKKILNQASDNLTPTLSISQFDDFIYMDKDKINVIKSGRNWYGDVFDFINEREYDFLLTGLAAGTNVKIYIQAMVASVAASKFTYYLNGTKLGDAPFGARSDVTYTYGLDSFTMFSINSNDFFNSETINLEVKYNKPIASSIGYLDYITFNYKRDLRYNGSQMNFRSILSKGKNNISKFNVLNTTNNVQIWDVSNPVMPVNQQFFAENNSVSYIVKTDKLKEYVVFEPEKAFDPVFHGKIPNQNLHGLVPPDIVILSYKEYYNPLDKNSPAMKLAEFKRNYQQYSVEVVTPQQIYNEFSSGRQDITAIRDFMKMLYDRSDLDKGTGIKYLIILGDASYDYKKIMSSSDRLVPTYQSYNSLVSTSSYCSDDYYAFLDDNEGRWLEGGSGAETHYLDIAIGRLPVNNTDEALGVVNKIIQYSSNPTGYGDWRNVLCFVADDGDGNTHDKYQANAIADSVMRRQPSFVVDKIYLDAYPQENAASGQRAPEVNAALLSRLNKGALVLNYTGHGGEVGWAHERIIETNDIKALKNFNNLPFFVTATCEFSRFDDPDRVSAGEWVLLNPNGGGIGLTSTTRVVFSNENFILNTEFINKFFEMKKGKYYNIGDIFKNTINTVWARGQGSINNRNFSLLGDPSMQLSYPRHTVKINKIYEISDSAVKLDTLHALCTISIEGEVINNKDGLPFTTFQGYIYPTVFEKKSLMTTLGDQGSQPWTYVHERNKIFRGLASVKNGKFRFSFTVPKDISYKIDYGKISLYAFSDSTDANGYKPVLIGGTCNAIINDQKGPEIEIYMNDESFVNGGLTNENPILFAKIKDTTGINTVGIGIGHEITALIDNNTTKTISLNDYYKAKLDNYKEGEIKYQINNLSPGPHKVGLRVWDVYNNSGNEEIEFVVANSEKFALDHVLNYPNPFSSRTEFMFEHNRFGEDLQLMIEVFTVTGKLVKTIEKILSGSESRVSGIYWNGLDDFDDKIGKGVYIYKVKVKSLYDGSYVQKFQKLVILSR